jgi:hypothetical protein
VTERLKGTQCGKEVKETKEVLELKEKHACSSSLSFIKFMDLPDIT